MKKSKTTFDRWMSDPCVKKHFETEYLDLSLSELILAIMDENQKSVRKLAEEVGISKTIIQNLKSGKQSDMKLSNFLNLIKVCGLNLVLESKEKRIQLSF
ncbi:MAG: helix-turn-helix transcriptional regulator [Candidatus Caenarcaniphilales bacterium]|nr:helix-turn-helix transcriptional regulator [Candidatus Caenarcaniphilales bacterium]